jgi:hypothetical protein
MQYEILVKYADHSVERLNGFGSHRDAAEEVKWMRASEYSEVLWARIEESEDSEDERGAL